MHFTHVDIWGHYRLWPPGLESPLDGMVGLEFNRRHANNRIHKPTTRQ
jgi:hypothetical protein